MLIKYKREKIGQICKGPLKDGNSFVSRLSDKYYCTNQGELFPNVIYCGSEGPRVNKSFAKTNLLEFSGSYIVFDWLGELYNATADTMKEQGYVVKHLNLCQPNKGDGYNPFLYFGDRVDISSFIEELLLNNSTYSLKKAEIEEDDPSFVIKGAHKLLYSIFMYVDRLPEQQKNLLSVMKLLEDKKTREDCFIRENDYLISSYYRMYSDGPYDLLGKIENYAAGCLRGSSENLEQLNVVTDTLSLGNIGKVKTVLYVSTSPNIPITEYMFLSQLFSYLEAYAKELTRLPVQIHVIMNDLESIPLTSLQLNRLLLYRNRGIYLNFGIQKTQSYEGWMKNRDEGRSGFEVISDISDIFVYHYNGDEIDEYTIEWLKEHGYLNKDLSAKKISKLSKGELGQVLILSKGNNPLRDKAPC